MTLELPAGLEMHVVPSGDGMDHATDEACVCGPTPQPVKRSDGSVGWIYTHHSLDAREANEGARPA